MINGYFTMFTCIIIIACIHSQVPTCVKMECSDSPAERLGVKDEWRCVTMECGGQCVLMAGMKWRQMLSVVNLDLKNQVLGDNGLFQLTFILILYYTVTIESYMYSSVERGNTTIILFHGIDCKANRHYSSLLDCVNRSSIRIETGSCDQDEIASVVCLGSKTSSTSPTTMVNGEVGEHDNNDCG